MISKKTVNAIELCVCLARQQTMGYVTTTELAPRLGLSQSYLESILKSLKDHDLVVAHKGPGGGYRILGDAALISMWDVAAVFEPCDEQAAKCADKAGSDPLAYETGLRQVVRDTLRRHTLADFAEQPLGGTKSYAQEFGRFKFKPLEAAFVPHAPNSVFQLHMMYQ